tara:strand:+ start:656 stop:889 length:234 start_codon:yes stop_codon:yes gene_type:complete
MNKSLWEAPQLLHVALFASAQTIASFAAVQLPIELICDSLPIPISLICVTLFDNKFSYKALSCPYREAHVPHVKCPK